MSLSMADMAACDFDNAPVAVMFDFNALPVKRHSRAVIQSVEPCSVSMMIMLSPFCAEIRWFVSVCKRKALLRCIPRF